MARASGIGLALTILGQRGGEGGQGGSARTRKAVRRRPRSSEVETAKERRHPARPRHAGRALLAPRVAGPCAVHAGPVARRVSAGDAGPGGSARSRSPGSSSKNRHLLGFDNPSKALLTTIKEAVDNSLDACEEAGILPELHIEVHDLALEASKQGRRAHQGRGPLPRGRAGQRPRHREGPGAEDLRQAPLRLEVPSPASRRAASRASASPRPRCTGSSPRASPSASPAAWARARHAHVFDIQLDTRKNEPVVTHDETLAQWHQEHGTRVELEIVANWQQGQRFVNRYVEHTALANPHATHPLHAAGGRGPARETPTSPATRR